MKRSYAAAVVGTTAVTAVALGVVSPAFAFWTTQASGSGQATAAALPTPAVTAGDITTSSIQFTAAAVSSGALAPKSYSVVDPNGDPACTIIAAADGSGSCTDDTAMSGKYTVVGNLELWRSPVFTTPTITLVPLDQVRPSVTIAQKAGQADPTNASPVRFTVQFDEPVTGFGTEDLDIVTSGSAAYTSLDVSGSGQTYEVEVRGLSGSGDVTASVKANGASDAAGNLNVASLNIGDRTVHFDAVSPNGSAGTAPGQAAGSGSVAFLVEFNEPVGNLDPTKVEITNGAGASTGKTISREDSRTFRITVGGLSHDGDVTASILAGASKDEAGNPTLAASHTITYNHLPTAPSAPDLAAGSDTGVSDSDNITKTTTGLVFKGTGEVGSTVQLVKGSTVLGSDTVNASGQWTITVSSALSEGDNVLFAQAVDSNSTIVGPSLTITIDTTPPPAPSAPDLRGDDDTGSSNTDNYTKAETIRLQGTAVTGTQITLYDGDTQLTTVTAVDGAYVFTLAPSSGPHSYTVRGAQDLAGNVSSTASSPLNVTIDREVTLSTLNATPNGTGATKSWTISGTREGTLTGNTPTVTVEKRNGQSNNYGTDASSAGSVTGSPNFSVALTLAQNASNATTSQVSATNYRVTVTQTDLAGNTLSRVIYLG